MDDPETSREATHRLLDIALAVEEWAENAPEEAAAAARQALADDDLASRSIPARVARLIAFNDGLVEEDRCRANRLGLKSLSDALGLGGDLSREIALGVYAVELDAHRRDLREVGHLGPALDWEKVREHFGLDEDGRRIGQDKAAGRQGGAAVPAASQPESANPADLAACSPTNPAPEAGKQAGDGSRAVAEEAGQRGQRTKESQANPNAWWIAWQPPAALAIGLAGVLIALFEALVYAIPWTWLKNHPNSYRIQAAVDILIVSGIAGLLQPRWRKRFWCATLLCGLLVAIITALGGPGNSPAVHGP